MYVARLTARRTVVIEVIKMNKEVPKTPTWRELNDRLEELEEQHELLGRRYDELTKLIRKQGKDKVVDDYNKYLRNYAKNWD